MSETVLSLNPDFEIITSNTYEDIKVNVGRITYHIRAIDIRNFLETISYKQTGRKRIQNEKDDVLDKLMNLLVKYNFDKSNPILTEVQDIINNHNHGSYEK